MFHIFKRKLRYYYISPLDQALDKLRRKLPLTPSQQYEIKINQKIAKLRDTRPDYPSAATDENN